MCKFVKFFGNYKVSGLKFKLLFNVIYRLSKQLIDLKTISKYFLKSDSKSRLINLYYKNK